VQEHAFVEVAELYQLAFKEANTTAINSIQNMVGGDD